MSKFLNAFLEFKNEDSTTKKVGLGAFLLITLSLALLSVSGAIASSQGEGFHWIIRGAFALLIFSAETLAAVIFVRAVLAGDRKKAAVCIIIWLGLSWTCVQNAKVGAHVIFPDRYEKTATQLAAEATIAGSDATVIDTVKQKAIEESPKELERVRTQIADQEAFLFKMSAMTPEGIKEAQSEMIGRCGYTGRVDGIRSVLTESAMRTCGERINRQLDVLRQRETSLSQGLLAAPATATSQGAGAVIDPRIRKAELDAAADKAWWDALKLEIMLWVLELARSMGLWAAFTSVQAADLSRARQRIDEIAEAEHAARLAAIRAGMPPEPVAPVAKTPEPAPAPISESPVSVEPPPAPPQPEPEIAPEPQPVTQEEAIPEPAPVIEPEPQPEPQPEPVPEPAYADREMSAAERRAKKGGDANAFYKRAEKLKIPLPEQFPEDVIEEEAA